MRRSGNYILIILLLFTINVHATHNRAGEITYRQISDLTYEFTISTYTYALSPANRDELIIEWGDNTYSIAPLVTRIRLPNDYFYNTYIAQHTFPGPGTFKILVQDPNRNLGVKNIPNSVNTIFSIATTMIISSWVGYNNTPELLNPPIDKAALGHVFIHNPAAFDIDGDSLSYSITVCTEADGKPIKGYTLPEYSDSLVVDPMSGDLIWNTPIDTGVYNIAMNIEEWRRGVKIGNIVRDMQIDVYNTDNNPPVNPPLTDYCVEAGTYIQFSVTSVDADNDPVIHSMTGGPMILEKDSATFETDSTGFGFVTSTFRWQTTCDHVRLQPYYLILKAEDVNNDISLVDLSNFTIKVLANAPENLETVPGADEITLNWDVSPCNGASGYKIYRHMDSIGFTPDSCVVGVPPETGYEFLDEVGGLNNTTYLDNNFGEGLTQGIEYCYMVTAIFPDGAESFASEEVCATLVPGNPALLNASVTNVDAVNGEIFVSWALPREIDPAEAPGPYVYHILRKHSIDDDFVLLDSIPSVDLSDTTYMDTPLNTVEYPYYYTVILYNNTPGNRFRIGTNEIASSLYMDIFPEDNRLTLTFRKKVPWLNENYVVYRQNGSGTFDSIGITEERQFTDMNLANNVQYTYQAVSHGRRPIFGIDFTNENISHIISGIPIDTVPPCPPEFQVESECDSMYNRVIWSNPNNYCADDVVKYYVYYSPTMDGEFSVIDSTTSPEDTLYFHYNEITLAGCYYVTAIDSFNNESGHLPKECLDVCSFYELPNVFTPNGDGINDKFRAKNLHGFVQKVDMKIFNRWGNLVYQTNDPYINWDGRVNNTNKVVSPGVYYYICDVWEPRITGLTVRNLAGFVHVYSTEDAQIGGE